MQAVGRNAAPVSIPDDVAGWNWGAFWLNWIWGIGNNTYIALLTFVPFVGFLVMPFVLGFKGSEWAWRNGRWDSIEHFRRVQRRWAIWGFVISMGTVSLFGVVVGGLIYGFGTSDAYRMGVARLDQSREAADMLGSPITAGFPMGSINVSGDAGEAVLGFSVTGTRATGRVALRAVRKSAVWSLTNMVLSIDGSGRTLDVLKDDCAELSLEMSSAFSPSRMACLSFQNRGSERVGSL